MGNLSSFVTAVAAVAFFASALPTEARVGVTSETDGDPVGKPPVDAERILRVGIDIQADELITTRQDDRAHVVFLDGTSVTLGPNAQIKIDKFVYDPDKKLGDIALSVTSGVFRVVGGKISKARAITVTTPSAIIGLRGGIALFDVGAAETTARFLFGISMVVSAHGRSETASRAGSEIVTRAGGFPGNPSVIPAGSLTPALARLEGRPNSAARRDGTPDERARQSGFSAQNSDRGIISPPPDAFATRTPFAAVDAVSNAGAQRGQPASIAASPAPVVGALPLPPALPAPPPAPPPVVVRDRWHHHDDFHHRHHRR